MSELRMYGLVPYNLSPIQQGIQFGHAVVEYSQSNFEDNDYQDWAYNWKTFIILNGGTSNLNPDRLGTMNQHLETLTQMGVKLATFHEIDNGDQLTAICFLVDEKVFNSKLYPSPKEKLFRLMNPTIENWCEEGSYRQFKMESGLESIWDMQKEEIAFAKEIGETNYKLREFLKQFRLA